MTATNTTGASGAAYYGPCNADRQPDLFPDKGECDGDAAEYVEVTETGTWYTKSLLMRLCTDHTVLASLMPGFVSRRPLTTPMSRVGGAQ